MAEKKDYEKLRQVAESMFVDNGMTARDIGRALSISEATLSRWRQEGDQTWDDKKRFIQITPSRLRELLLREAEKVAKGEASTVNAAVVVKLLSGAEKLAAKATPDVIYSVLSECCTYAATIDAEGAGKMAELHRLFLNHKIEQYNG